jgi:hypothetical protein
MESKLKALINRIFTCLGIIRAPDWSDQKWDIDCPESPNWTMTRKK